VWRFVPGQAVPRLAKRNGGRCGVARVLRVDVVWCRCHAQGSWRTLVSCRGCLGASLRSHLPLQYLLPTYCNSARCAVCVQVLYMCRY